MASREDDGFALTAFNIGMEEECVTSANPHMPVSARPGSKSEIPLS